MPASNSEIFNTINASTSYKSNIIERLGGEALFDFTILAFAEAIKNDPNLETFFGSFPIDNLVLHEKRFLYAAFRQHPADGCRDNHNVQNYILLRHFDLIEKGFNESHFDILVKHFVIALEDSWTDKKVIDDAVALILEYRSLFGEGNGLSGCIMTSTDDDAALSLSAYFDSLSKDDSMSRSTTSAVGKKSILKKSGSNGKSSEEDVVLERRSSSGEFLLNSLREKGTKRAKQ